MCPMHSDRRIARDSPRAPVDFLQHIAPPIGVRFVGAGQTLQRVAVVSNGALVELPDTARVGSVRSWVAHLRDLVADCRPILQTRAKPIRRGLIGTATPAQRP